MFSVFRDLVRYNIEFTIGLILVTLVVVLACLSFVSPVDPPQSIARPSISRQACNICSAPIRAARTWSGS